MVFFLYCYKNESRYWLTSVSQLPRSRLSAAQIHRSFSFHSTPRRPRPACQTAPNCLTAVRMLPASVKPSLTHTWIISCPPRNAPTRKCLLDTDQIGCGFLQLDPASPVAIWRHWLRERQRSQRCAAKLAAKGEYVPASSPRARRTEKGSKRCKRFRTWVVEKG